MEVSESEQKNVITQLKSVSGETILPEKNESLKITEPMGWGQEAKWPLFTIVCFFGIKFGRRLGEFLFMPYEK